MKYKDLINFSPIDRVVQLSEAKEEDKIIERIKSYFISESMEIKISNLLIDNLDFENRKNIEKDKQGIFIEGNYGSGKSHLMLIISTIMENEKYVNYITNDKIKDKIKQIAGKFKVLRIEIGSVKTLLRDIVCNELEGQLEAWGVQFKFPPIEKITNNKDAFKKMMDAFSEKYPDKGLAIFMDEILDYLRSQKDQELMLSLNFLREMGEFCKGSRFKFVAGLQEALLSVKNFSFYQSELKRIMGRYDTLSIEKNDLKYVISNRILMKNQEQKDKIREHLFKFSTYYNGLQTSMEEFVELFPIHPHYILIFDKLHISGEKRGVLTELSKLCEKILEDTVKEDEPSVFSFDHYWDVILKNQYLQTYSEIYTLTTIYQSLDLKIRTSLANQPNFGIINRIIKALFINQLTYDNIERKFGLTVDELVENLLLFIPDCVDRNFLITSVETGIEDVMNAVSGQYLSYNEKNGQYYIDIKKVVDYDKEIEDRAERIDNSTLDNYYFSLLKKLMTVDEKKEYVPGYRIWQYNIEWLSHKYEMQGYLFFGSPNERSTAQPERNFYIFFLATFDPTPYPDIIKEDEIIFEINEAIKDSSLFSNIKKNVALYAASTQLAEQSSTSHKKIYEKNKLEHQNKCIDIINRNFTTLYTVKHSGKTKPLIEISKEFNIKQSSFTGFINQTSAQILDSVFEKIYPKFPSFSSMDNVVSEENQSNYIKESISFIYGTGKKNSIIESFLSAFGIKIDAKNELTKKSIKDSPYMNYFIELLDREDKKVINLESLYKDYKGRKVLDKFKIDQEMTLFLLSILMKIQPIILHFKDGVNITLDDYNNKRSSLKYEDLIGFSQTSYSDLLIIKRLLDLFGIEINSYEDINQMTVNTLIEKNRNLLTSIVEFENKDVKKQKIWNQTVLNETEKKDLLNQISIVKVFLEEIKEITTDLKLKMLKIKIEKINEIKLTLDQIKEYKEIFDRIKRFTEDINEVETMQKYVENSEISEQIIDLREKIVQLFQSPSRNDETKDQKFKHSFNRIRKIYIDTYIREHQKVKFSNSNSILVKKIKGTTQYKNLVKMQNFQTIYDFGEFKSIRKKLDNVYVCEKIEPSDIESNIYCPKCQFIPSQQKDDYLENNIEAIGEIETKIKDLHAELISKIVEFLNSEDVQAAVDGLNVNEKRLLKTMRSIDGNIEITDEMISLLNSLSKGINVRYVDSEEIKIVLSDGGFPCKKTDFVNRIKKFAASIEKLDSNARIIWKGEVFDEKD